MESDILYHEDAFSTLQTVRQHEFIKNEFHYLNVPRVATSTVHDVFDCTFECLSNPLCFSVNLAASKGASGKLWCELLSSDKYRNSTEYQGNKSSHHFAIKVGNTENTCFFFLFPVIIIIIIIIIIIYHKKKRNSHRK